MASIPRPGLASTSQMARAARLSLRLRSSCTRRQNGSSVVPVGRMLLAWRSARPESALVGLLLVTVHGIEQPTLAASTHFVCALGFVAASFRWRYRVIAHFGVWLLLLATLWSLWAVVPDQRDVWGVVVAGEALVLATAALLLTRFHRLRDACRDVASAAGLLAPTFALFALSFVREPTVTGILFLLAATAIVLASLYRQRELTWAGSLIGLLAIAHLLAFPMDFSPGVCPSCWHFFFTQRWRLSRQFCCGERSGVSRPMKSQTHQLIEDRKPTAPGGLRRSARPGCSPTRCGSLPASHHVWPCCCCLFPKWGTRYCGPHLQSGPAFCGWQRHSLGTNVVRSPRFRRLSLGQLGCLASPGLKIKTGSRVRSASSICALQAYGLAISILSIGWELARRASRSWTVAREMWNEFRPSLDRVVLAGLVVGQLLLVAGGLLPHVVAELTPIGVRLQSSRLRKACKSGVLEPGYFWGR